MISPAPKVLTEADLAGLPRAVSTPNDLPSVGTEDAAQAMANYTLTIVADSGYESTTEGRCSAKQYGAVIYALHNDDSYADQRDKLVSERDALDDRVAELEAEREPKSLNAKIADQLRPFLKPGDKVIWREAFRWKDDNGVLPNHYDGMELPQLAAEFGYDVLWDTNMHHAAIVRAALSATTPESKP